MNFKKIIALLGTVLILCGVAVGCDSTKSYVLYMELNEEPDTLDPQLVSGNSEELIVKNLFEGLMRKDDEGNIVNGAAESYTLSKDGLTYTFTLRDDIKWSNGDPLTADEFVFGFTRAVNPKNLAPYVSSLYNIVGAEAIASGKNTALGVIAPDDKTVQIRLKSPDPNFLETLTTAICMPCHKVTYEKAKGHYGKTGDHIVSNGSFRLRYWNKDTTFSLRLNKNEEYNGNFKSEAVAVILSAGEIKGRAARIDKANLDLGFIEHSEATGGSNLFTFEKTCYTLVINKKSAFGSADFRKAFALSVHRNRMKNELGKSLTEASSILPSSVMLNGKPLADKVSTTTMQYDPNAAYDLYLKTAKEIKNLPSSIEILYYGNNELADMARLIAESFQQSLGAVVNLKAADSEDALRSSVNSGNYQLAIVPITAQNDDPKQYLSNFVSSAGEKNIFGFTSPKYDSEVSRITPTADKATVIKATQNAINILLADMSIIPLCLYTEAFAYGIDFSVPYISPYNGVVDLALVRKLS